jgi:hypothetical protein
METEIIGEPGTAWTDAPRELTREERQEIAGLSRVDGVKLHRALTRSTLAAAVRVVDALQSAEESYPEAVDLREEQ